MSTKMETALVGGRSENHAETTFGGFGSRDPLTVRGVRVSRRTDG